MAKAKIRLDRGGMKAMLSSGQVAKVVHSAARSVADNYDRELSSGELMDVRVEDGKTDRARSVVVVAHPAALRDQAKYGSLTKAASAAGLEVNAR